MAEIGAGASASGAGVGALGTRRPAPHAGHFDFRPPNSSFTEKIFAQEGHLKAIIVDSLDNQRTRWRMSGRGAHGP
jgi:hypothetical protein